MGLMTGSRFSFCSAIYFELYNFFSFILVVLFSEVLLLFYMFQ